MALVAVSIVGAESLPAEAFRKGGAALAARLEIHALGHLHRESGLAGMAAVLRTRVGPHALEALLERLSLESGEISFHLLSYGALVYRDESLSVPPPGVANLRGALRSLAELDPGFEIPTLGNVSTHLRDASNRHPL